MAKEVEFKEATIKRSKQYKFGKFMKKGEKVFIKEEKTTGGIVYTAYRQKNDVLGFGVSTKDFQYSDKKHTVYVAWNMEDADALENGKIALSRVEKFTFDTDAEVKAFRMGIEKCAGSDAPYHVSDGEFVIKNRTLLLK